MAGRFSSWLKVLRKIGNYTIVSRCIGVLLLTAAALKLWGLRVDAVPSLDILSSPEIKVGLIEFEIFLGVWLLSGKAIIGAWLTAIGTFATFSAFSGHQAWVGEASCGCFGRLSQYVKPWHTFTLDMTILSLLALARPDFTFLRANPRAAVRGALVPLVAGVVSVLALWGVLVGVGNLAFGSTDAALARLRGELIAVSPRLVDVGNGSPREVLQQRVTVANYTGHPIRIIGGTSDCSCITTDDLPIGLESGETKEISIAVRLPSNPGILTRRVVLFTDDEAAHFVTFRITGRVLAGDEAAAIVEKR